MPIRSFDQKCIALTQLETAIRLYFERSDYFSVITLAGAAEEIFGKMVSAKGIENSLESKKRAVDQISQKLFGRPVSSKWTADRANMARNVLKHLTSPTVTFDPNEEAKGEADFRRLRRSVKQLLGKGHAEQRFTNLFFKGNIRNYL